MSIRFFSVIEQKYVKGELESSFLLILVATFKKLNCLVGLINGENLVILLEKRYIFILPRKNKQLYPREARI